ncbi:uncharacterized protein N7529_007188 [Penicillium soppii]|uniref:uncharacterized protein n=1 Tax=Penicillium soppii TaxID=69789 RepID=UPI0025466997|nr:uncharacterized protein N7529_007188 [Penicillium soppii]KAJ5865272.1 hypothetical protein N7529_007188 [Penicillium soppii]
MINDLHTRYIFWLDGSPSRSHPVLTSVTSVSRILPHITHTHLTLRQTFLPFQFSRRVENWPCTICGLSTAERTGSPVFHTLWSYVVGYTIEEKT